MRDLPHYYPVVLLTVTLLLAGCEAASPTVPVVDLATRPTPTAVPPTPTSAMATAAEPTSTPTIHLAATPPPLQNPEPTVSPMTLATPTATFESTATPTPVPVPSADSPTLGASLAPTAIPTAAATPVPGFDPEAYFGSAEAVRIMVPAGPGGGTDSYARLVARSLSKFLPGAPRVLVSNTSSSYSALLSVLEELMLDPSSGEFTILAIWPHRTKLLMTGGISSALVDIDLNNLEIVAGVGGDSMASISDTQAMWTFNNYATTWQQVLAKSEQPVYGTLHNTDLNSLANQILGAFDAPIQFEGRFNDELRNFHAQDQRLIHLSSYSLDTVEDFFPEWLANRQIVPLFHWGMHPSSDQAFMDYVVNDLEMSIPPHLSDIVGLNEKQKAIFLQAEVKETHEIERLNVKEKIAFTLNQSVDEMSRVLFLRRPSTQSHIHRVWVEAFRAALHDPEFSNNLESTGFAKPEYVDPADLQRLFAEAKIALQNPEALEAFQVFGGLTNLMSRDGFREFVELQ